MIGASTAALAGKYVGATVAIFGPPAVGAAVGRRFENRWLGIGVGALAGAALPIVPILLLAIV